MLRNRSGKVRGQTIYYLIGRKSTKYDVVEHFDELVSTMKMLVQVTLILCSMVQQKIAKHHGCEAGALCLTFLQKKQHIRRQLTKVHLCSCVVC